MGDSEVSLTSFCCAVAGRMKFKEAGEVLLLDADIAVE